MWKKIWDWILSLFGGGSSFKNFADPRTPFKGYGLVNNWVNQNQSKYMEKLVKAEVPCIAIEFFEWAKSDNFKNVDKLISKFKDYVDEAKKRKIIIYVTLLNCNVGSGKYGDKKIKAPTLDAYIKKAANAIAELMKKNSFIYCTPCGEGGLGPSGTATYDRSLQNYCKSIMPLSQMVNNWGARSKDGEGMAFFCQHQATVNTAVAKTAWSMSDHSTIIGQLNGGGGLYGTCNYDITKKYAIKMKNSGNPFIYYHFNPSAGIDDVALKALKDA